MPLVKGKGKAADPAAGPAYERDEATGKAREVFEYVSAEASERAVKLERFARLPATETISFRVPTGETLRLRNLFARHGMKLTHAVKEAVYRYAKELEP